MAQVFGMSLNSLMMHISPTENMPSSFEETGEWLTVLPMVVDWLRRSAFRRGAAMALSLGLAHFPDDFDLDDVTSGYPAPNREITRREVEALYKRAAPYAQRVLDMGDFLPHQHTVDAPGDEPAVERDYPSMVSFRTAI